MKYIILALLLNLSFMLSAQTEAQINTELTNRGITSQADINAELAKRGMTEADARRMAAMYGIDYDSYIAKYIAPSISTPAVAISNVNPANKIQETVTQISYTNGTNLDPIPDNVVAPKTDPKYFGYSIFENNPFANKDYLVGNIDEGYILSPGDELRIYIWGANTYQAQVKIDLNGNIALPDNGVFFATGQTLTNFKTKLTNYLGKSYNGLLTKTPTSFIDVSLTQLRPVSITVLGESNTPGPHLINGFATVLNALYASGGIKTSGSLRDIKVYRDNKLIKSIDLYDYIIKGSLDNYVRLMNNDIIFIPNRFSSITLSGAVHQSAIFELKPNEGLNDLIAFSGGLLPSASLKDVSISRIIPFADRKKGAVYNREITSVNLSDTIASKKNYQLFDGDNITIHSILDKVINKVTIKGSVKRPGTYPISKYEDLRSLITLAADSLAPNTYMQKLDIYRVDADGSRRFKTLNLEEVLSGKTNYALQNDDEVVIYNLADVQNQEMVRISGFVKEPKTMFWSANLSLYDVLFSSTNLEELEYKSKILTSRVDVKRFNQILGKFEIQIYDLNQIISREKLVLLLPKDEVIVYSKDINKVIAETITINGKIRNPGTYALTENMTVEDVILQAGGFTEFADKVSVNVARPSYDVDKGKLSDIFPINIHADYLTGLSKEKASDFFMLKHNDVINVRQMEGYETQKTISIYGEVRRPGSVTLDNKKQSVNDIIAAADGLTPFASLKASYIVRNDKKFIYDMGGNNNDINFLENGDQIVIASNTGTVAVIGAVDNEGLFVWQKGMKMRAYLRQSGFKNNKVEKVLVTGPNGITHRKKWLNNPKILPNSTIYVYAKIEKVKNNGNNRGLDDFIKILSILTGTLTTAILATKL